MEILYYLQSFLNEIPWKSIGLFLGGGATGGGVAKLIEKFLSHNRESRAQRQNIQEELRNELRKEIDDLRTRLQVTEEEIVTWRKKHFELQEKYHELKREHDTAQDNIEKLRTELQKYKDN